jgi:predicted nucleic acid-binding protein
VIIDSDVLIWMSRGNRNAADRLQRLLPWHISVVTYIELAQGFRDKRELAEMKRGLSQCQTIILPVTPEISDRAMLLIDNYALSHGLRLADALIAATALLHDDALLTANAKHFACIEGLRFEMLMV